MMVYLPTWMVDFSGKLVGKITLDLPPTQDSSDIYRFVGIPY